MKAQCLLLFFFLTMPTVVFAAGLDDSGAAAAGTSTNVPMVTVSTSEKSSVSCQDLAMIVRENQAATSRDLREIKRDLARLEQKLDKPGLGQILAGIGYIFGLFGVAAFVASRKKQGEK